MPAASQPPRQRWIVNTDYLSIEKRGEDPVRVERGQEYPGDPSKALIEQEWVCPMPADQVSESKSEGGS